MNNLWKAIILSCSLLLAWSWDKLTNATTSTIQQVFDILESEQLSLEEIIKELNSQDRIIKEQREKVSYEIVRIESLGLAGYESNKREIEKSKKLIDKYDLQLFEIKSLLEKINSWEISQKDANKKFRKIESIVWNLFTAFTNGWYLFINKETETARKD